MKLVDFFYNNLNRQRLSDCQSFDLVDQRYISKIESFNGAQSLLKLKIILWNIKELNRNAVLVKYTNTCYSKWLMKIFHFIVHHYTQA